MRLAKLCITLALATGGCHAALANALCARYADCHGSAAPRAPQAHTHTAGREAEHHAPASAPDDHSQVATREAVAPTSNHGHCGPQVESPETVAHAAPRDAEAETAHDDENGSSSGSEENELSGGNDISAAPGSASDPRAPASSCAHCVGQQTSQPASVNSGATVSARDAHATPAPAPRRVALTPAFARPRFAPTEHSPPRGRPLHLLNSALLI